MVLIITVDEHCGCMSGQLIYKLNKDLVVSTCQWAACNEHVTSWSRITLLRKTGNESYVSLSGPRVLFLKYGCDQLRSECFRCEHKCPYKVHLQRWWASDNAHHLTARYCMWTAKVEGSALQHFPPCYSQEGGSKRPDDVFNSSIYGTVENKLEIRFFYTIIRT